MKRMKGIPLNRTVAATALTSLLLVGCGGESSSRHDHTPIETSGRLAVFDQDAQQIRVLDLDTGNTLERFPVDGSAPSLYSSPGHRYTVVVQRIDNRVSFIDGGLYQEDHGDHRHDYAETPRQLSLTLSGNRPTHVTVSGPYMTIFNDGTAGVADASVSVFSDATLELNEILAVRSLENNQHGAAQFVNDHLFVTRRDSSITDTTLPSEVERHHRHGDHFHFEERYSELCPRLHGSASNSSVVAFGCSDGVLLIDLTDSEYPATKLANPEQLAGDARIGTLAGHPDVAEMVGIAGNQLFVIHPGEQAYDELPLPEGATRVAQGFTPDGSRFYILDSEGTLHLFDPAHHWDHVAVANVVADTSDGVSVAGSATESRLFLLVSGSNAVVEIDTHAGSRLREHSLEFSGSGLSWMGLAGAHDHDHDHDHDHE